ncbi:hypothetical protein MMC10_007464 [Thelotrema lepadinum]|nr:hypothetical protein [Thelotrema lepadinum]
MAASTVHTTGSIEQPTTAQQHFADGYDLDHPIEAIHNYARIMHRHTKTQMEIAYRSSRRRNDNDPTPAVATLAAGESTDSMDSRV